MAFEDNVQQLLQDSISGITAYNTQINGVFVSGLLLPMIVTIAKQQAFKDLMSVSQSLVLLLNTQENTDKIRLYADAMGMTDEEVFAMLSVYIENFIGNFNKTRHPAIASSGLAQMGRDAALLPTDSDIVIPIGAQIQTLSGVVFSVTAQTTMYAQLGSTYYNSFLGKYTIDVPVEAVTAGTTGNVQAEEISQPVGSFPTGITYVTNVDSFTDGSAEESDPELISRFLSTIRASNLGSADGYRAAVLNNFPRISDAFVATAGSSFLARERGYGGAVDIYLLERSLLGAKETVAYDGTLLTHVLAYQPAIIDNPASDIVITGTAATVPTIFVYGTDYIFIEDTNLLTIKSGGALSQILWLTTGPAVRPDIGTSYYIFHLYDRNVYDIQNYFNTKTNTISAVSVLVREATKVEVDMAFSIEIDTGYIFATVQNAVTTAIVDYINELKLGEELTQSKIIQTVEGIAGVVEVKLPMTSFNETGLIPVVSSVVPTEIEYIRLGTLTISEF